MNNKELKENANGTNAEAVPAEKQPNLFKNNNCPSVPDGNGDMKGKKLIEIPSYENDWGKRHFDDEDGNPKQVWEKDGVTVPI